MDMAAAGLGGASYSALAAPTGFNFAAASYSTIERAAGGAGVVGAGFSLKMSPGSPPAR
jgi:hypothetical protein